MSTNNSSTITTVIQDAARGEIEGKIQENVDEKVADVTGDTAGGEIEVETNGATPSSLFTRVRILIGYTQICAALNMSFEIPWPNEFIQFIQGLGFINLNLFDVLSPISPCALTTPFLTASVIHMAMLPLCGFIIVLARWIALLRRTNKYTKHEVNSRSSRTMLFAVFMLYPGIGTRIFRTLKCVRIGDTQWLMADYSIKCWEGQHFQTSMLMAICAVLYVVGIPICCVIILFRNRTLILNAVKAESKEGQNFRDTYGSLFTSYDKNHWYFESVEMIKKMTLAGGLVLVAPGSSVQILVGILVAFSYLVLVFQYRPYEDANDNKLQAFATTQIVLTLLAGLVLKTDASGEYEQSLMGILLVLINGSVVVIGAYATLLMLPLSCCYGRSRVQQDAVLNSGVLKNVHLFAHLPHENMKQIIYKMHHKRYTKKGAVLFKRGEKANTMLLITKGTIDIMINNKKVREMRVPEVLGEAAMIQKHRRTASAVVGSNGHVETLYLTSNDFDALVSEGVIDGTVVQQMRSASIRWDDEKNNSRTSQVNVHVKKNRTKVLPTTVSSGGGEGIKSESSVKVARKRMSPKDAKQYLLAIRQKFGAGSNEYRDAAKSLDIIKQ